MTAATNPDDQTPANPTPNPTPNPSRPGPILARMTDGNCLTLVGDAVSELPAAEWFEVACADGKIVLSPIPSPLEAWRLKLAKQGLSEDQVSPPTEWDLTPPAERVKSPYANLTLDQLRTLEHITTAERIEELCARGIIVPAYDGPPPHPFKPVEPPVPPGGLERFLKERG